MNECQCGHDVLEHNEFTSTGHCDGWVEDQGKNIGYYCSKYEQKQILQVKKQVELKNQLFQTFWKIKKLFIS